MEVDRAAAGFMALVMSYAAEYVMEDDEDDNDWEKVTVNIEEYRLMGDPSFRRHFRLTKPVFEILCQEVGNSLVQAELLIRERRPLPHILLIALWIISTPDTFRSVASRFGVHPGEAHRHYVLTLFALNDIGRRFITWPSAEERIRISNNLERISGFRGIVGVLDATQICIPAPIADKAAYRDRHHNYSVKLQAVCDDQLLFRDVYIGEAGSLHDARVFRRSPLCANILQQPDMISRGEHIIADSAYTLLDKVMVPFLNDGHLRAIQINFNRRLSKVRVLIEQTFGRLKMMWRRLFYLASRNMLYAVDHIAACCVLHNFKILNGEDFNLEDIPHYERGNGRGGIFGEAEAQPGFMDQLHDPHVPRGDFVVLLRNANVRGDLRRWEIANRLAELIAM